MNRAAFPADLERPRCVGSVAYGSHPARPPRAYTVITPLGKVMYACDSDCLRPHLDQLEALATDDVRRSPRPSGPSRWSS